MKKESVIQQKIDKYLSDMNMNIENLKLGSDSLKFEWDIIMKLRTKKESVIQQEIVEYLSGIAEKYNFFFFSIPNEGFMVAAMYGLSFDIRHATLNKLKKMGMVPGMPDLCLLHEGRAYMFEIKRPDGKLSEKQKRIDDKLRKCKTPCFVIVSLEDMEKTLQHLWIIK